MRINFEKYKVKYSRDPKPDNKHYRRMVKRIKRSLPRINGQ